MTRLPEMPTLGRKARERWRESLESRERTLADQQLEDLRQRQAELARERDALPLRALRSLEEHREALAWTDAAKSLSGKLESVHFGSIFGRPPVPRACRRAS